MFGSTPSLYLLIVVSAPVIRRGRHKAICYRWPINFGAQSVKTNAHWTYHVIRPRKTYVLNSWLWKDASVVQSAGWTVGLAHALFTLIPSRLNRFVFSLVANFPSVFTSIVSEKLAITLRQTRSSFNSKPHIFNCICFLFLVVVLFAPRRASWSVGFVISE